MCGISAIVALPGGHSSTTCDHDISEGSSSEAKARRAQLTEEMEASLKNIQHRGPDYSGVWISSDESIVFGHARLAIMGLSPSGNQPLHSPDGTVHAVVNGELYDYEEIKAKLVQEIAYPFSSHTDSELVLALYQAYGLDFVQHLRGEFAICIYDERKRLFIAVRDRYGIKPLFWTIQNGRLLVAAEIKAFLPLAWTPEWDVKSIIEAGWNFDDRTLFKDVKKVRPGCVMTCDAEGAIEQRQYWDIEYPDKMVLDTRTEAEIVQGVRDRLEEAVRIRLRADVPIGVYLSGGIDSSVISGLVTDMVRKQGEAMGNLPSTDRVSCFCVAFEKTSGFDESDVAERTAEWLGVKFHKQIMDEEAFASRFELATWHCEHHNPDLNYIGKFALSEIPQSLGFKVVLTGEGSDEIFTGYHIYLPDVLREPDLTWQDT
ncbi:N-terminal nucleophile aminohydrolase, partial [Cadophora sp. DSE1049]